MSNSIIIGTWHLRMKTPIGTIEADYVFENTSQGVTGIAAGAGESVALRDITGEAGPDGERVTWRQSINRPLRLNLEFDVLVVGNTLSGHSRAGRLPRTVVTGERTAA